MPWKETCVIDEKIKFVAEALDETESMKDLCAAYGISRKTGYKWLERYKSEGVSGLCNKSRAPYTHPNAMKKSVKKEILTIKRKYKNWGPKKIRAVLEKNAAGEIPAASTIGSYLKIEGLVRVKRRRRRAVPTKAPLARAIKENDVWCADFKGHFKTEDGSRCNPLTITDQYSRFLLACKHTNKMNLEETKKVFEMAFGEYGLPLVMRTDNGLPFASTNRYGLSKLSFWWIRLGIYPERIEPGRPDQNGRHERMHRTLKQDVANPPASSILAQQNKFDEFKQMYNFERPHEAIKMLTPSDLYSKSNRIFTENLSQPEYPDHMKVYKIRKRGNFVMKGKNIFVSECLHNECVGIEQLSEDQSAIWYCNYELGILNHRTWSIKPIFCKPMSKDIKLSYLELSNV